MTTLKARVTGLMIALMITTLLPTAPAIGADELQILQNGSGSLTVKLDEQWARNHQAYDGRGTLIAEGERGDAGVCVVGVHPLSRQKDWTTSCVFTAARDVDRSFSAMLTIARANEEFFDAETFHYIGIHCFLDKDGYPQGWIHTQDHKEPVPTMTFQPSVRAGYSGQDRFTFQFSAEKKTPDVSQTLTIIFSNGKAEARCILDARTIRPEPFRPWFVSYGTPNKYYCGPAQWTIHSVDYKAPALVSVHPAFADANAFIPAPKEILWSVEPAWFILDDAVSLDVGKEATSPAANSLRRQIVERSSITLKGRGNRTITIGERGREHTHLDRFCLEEGVSPPANREGYIIVVKPDRIFVVGTSSVGTYYGVQTLAQMVEESSNRGWQIPCCTVTDWPDFQFRGTYIQETDMQHIRTFSEKKINAVVFEDFLNFFNPGAPTLALKIFDECRQLGIEPIPLIQGFGHGDEVLRHNPNWAEGIYKQDEELVFARGLDAPPVRLEHPNVIRTRNTTIVVTDGRGGTYEEGRDYIVIAGDLELYQPPDNPFSIVRLASGNIPDGGTAFASYDYALTKAQERRDLSFCPSEPEAYEWLRERVEAAVRELRPNYLMIGRDEPMRMSTDSRCITSGKTNAELFAHDVQRMVKFATAIDPTVEVLMWADAVNPYRNAYAHTCNPTGMAIDRLPRQIILMPWFYGNFEKLAMANSIEFFSQKGFRTIGGASKHVWNPKHWAEVGWHYRGQERGVLGLLLTPWENAEGDFSIFANYAWAHTP